MKAQPTPTRTAALAARKGRWPSAIAKHLYRGHSVLPGRPNFNHIDYIEHNRRRKQRVRR